MQEELDLGEKNSSKAAMASRDLKWMEGMEYKLITNEQELEELYQILDAAPIRVIDLETTGLNPRQAKIVGCSFAVKEKQAFYLPMHHVSGNVIPYEKFITKFKTMLETKPWICHHAKFEWEMLMETAKVDLCVAHDTMIMAYLIDINGETGLKALAKRYLKTEMIEIEDLLGKKFVKGTFDILRADEAVQYGCADSERCFALFQLFLPKMKEFEFIYRVERGLVKIIGKMELTGVTVDVEMLTRMAEEYTGRIEQAKKEVYELMQCTEADCDLDSPAQVGNILFNKMGVPIVNKSKKTGKASTSKDALKELEDDYPVVKKIQEYKTMVKIRSTYLVGLKEAAENGVVHTSFLPWWFGTGRFASSGPNLQNIPKEKHNVRKAFVPRPDHYFAEGDYSQIEVRVMASEAQAQKLIEAFKRGEDIHKATAVEMFGVSIDQVNHDQRQAGKKINFGLNYGQTSWGLARELKVPEEVASELMRKYFDRVDGVKQYVATTQRNAIRDGYVKTHFGRKRELPELYSSVKAEHNKGKRGAVNTIIQGTAADIMKIAFIKVAKVLEPYGTKVNMLLTVHDSILFEIHNSLKPEEILPVIKAAAEFPIAGYVPLVMDFKLGANWGELDEKDMEREESSESAHAAVQEMLDKKSQEDFPCVVFTLNERVSPANVAELKKIFAQCRGDHKVFLMNDGKKVKLSGVMINPTRDFQLRCRAIFTNDLGVKVYDVNGVEVKPDGIKVTFV